MQTNQTNQSNQNKNQQPIRNLQAFLKAYIQSESGKRALNRPLKLIDKTTEGYKGATIHYKEYGGSNQLAHAFADAIHA